jgi:TonB-dependent SusC/RagA subfamily outer membrane receptor
VVNKSEIKSNPLLESLKIDFESADKPLILVDNKEVTNRKNISPEEIYSFSILKDNTATAIYGEKGKNGVVLITTKAKSSQEVEGEQQRIKLQEQQNAQLQAKIAELEQQIAQLQKEQVKQISQLEIQEAMKEVQLQVEQAQQIAQQKIQEAVKEVQVQVEQAQQEMLLQEISFSLKEKTGNEPLIIVNDIEVSSFTNINPNDIETISVLKDNSASTLYGKKGKNGVVLITTKRKNSNPNP